MQIDTAISKEVTHRAVDLVDAAGRVGELRSVLRQLHFKSEVAQQRWSALRSGAGAQAHAVTALSQRKQNLTRLHEVLHSFSRCPRNLSGETSDTGMLAVAELVLQPSGSTC